LVVVIEEVMDFATIDSTTGVSHLSKCVRNLEAAGRAVRVFSIDHNVFMEKPRVRLYIVGISQRAGGEKSAQFVQTVVDSVINLRRLSPPVKFVPTIVDLDSPDETARRDVSKAGPILNNPP
jgi:NAD(P)-dependent dehydrogenase (short-subunit alcohol dehydrogenase family)